MSIQVKTIFNIILFYFLFIKVLIAAIEDEKNKQNIPLLNVFSALTLFGMSMNIMRIVTHHLPLKKLSDKKKDWVNLKRSFEVLRYKLRKVIKLLKSTDLNSEANCDMRKKAVDYYKKRFSNYCTHYYNTLLESDCVLMTTKDKNLLLYVMSQFEFCASEFLKKDHSSINLCLSSYEDKLCKLDLILSAIPISLPQGLSLGFLRLRKIENRKKEKV